MGNNDTQIWQRKKIVSELQRIKDQKTINSFMSIYNIVRD